MAIRFGDLTIGCKCTALFVEAVARLQSCLNGGCARETFGSAGFSDTGSPTCVQLSPYRLATTEWRQAMADYRIRTVTQVLENIAFRSELETDSVVLSDFAQLLAIPLRDG